MWRGEKYDFHGQCDLDLLSDPTFLGKGIKIQIRTKIVRGWSYIHTAVLQLGDDLLQVQGGATVQNYWVNKEYQGKLSTLAGFPVSYKKANSKSHSYTVDLGKDTGEIEIRTYQDFVRIDFKDPKNNYLYRNTVGLLGDFTTGKKLARDGITVVTDNNAFGQEWQVLPGDHLFHEVSGPQLPFEKCMMPKELHELEKRRRLGAKVVTETMAELACERAGIPELDRDACVFDVMEADDVDIAGAY